MTLIGITVDAQVDPNLLRMLEKIEGREIVFPDILEVRLTDGSRLQGCFALRKRIRTIVGMAFDYHMWADLVINTIQKMTFEVPGSVWHSDQGKQFGAEKTHHFLLQKGFALLMNCAGTPTDNSYTERFVGTLSWLPLISIGITVWTLSCKQRRDGSIFTISSILMRD